MHREGRHLRRSFGPTGGKWANYSTWWLFVTMLYAAHHEVTAENPEERKQLPRAKIPGIKKHL
jgi:hypothetical protein